jgi:isochorismate synthase
LNEFITYRFPGKEIIQKTGYFKQLSENEVPNGFVVSNFDQSMILNFIEDESQNQEFHFSKETPYCMTAREYYLQAHELLNGINVMQMDKAVFSRIKNASFNYQNSKQLFENLCVKHPKAFVYLISSEHFGTWVGASPEILIEAHDNYLFTTSLAGTKKTNENRDWIGKEFFEQQVVTDYVIQVLKKIKSKAIEQNGPYDYEAGPVTHLRTDISASLDGKNPWEIAKLLHPTPAVSGSPKQEAIDLIQSIEPHQRELYSGMIGVIQENSCKMYVNLRCAQIQEKNIYLYLGGGYTRESIPEMEWVETENKSKTILSSIEK